MAKTITTKTGKQVTLLNPSEKGNKYAKELKNGYRMTNDLKYKVDKNGEVYGLSDTQKAYRSGYLSARKDSANAYKSKQKKK